MSFSRSRMFNDERVEAIKSRLNASNIIKEETLNQSIHSRREPTFKSSVLPGNLNLPLQNNYKVGDMKGRIERELNQGVGLTTDKKQLMLLIDDQVEIQAKIKADYVKQIEGSRNQMDITQRNMAELSRELDEKLEKLGKKQDANGQMESELNSLSEENKTLEGEIKRLGEKTSHKINEMQIKMQNVLNELQIQKDKHQQELDRLNQFSTDKIKRLEEELTKKATTAQDRYNDLLAIKQDAEAELFRLQDTKKRAEAELEDKIKIIKQEFYDEDSAQFAGILRINQNKLRGVIDNKEQLQKKQVQLQKDLENLSRDLEKAERELLNSNQSLEEEVRVAREDIMKIQKDIDEARNKNMNIDANVQKLQSEINKNKFNFKQISENSKFKVKDMIERFRAEIASAQSKILAQQQKNKDLSDELTDAQNKFAAIEKSAQRMVESMRTQLNRNIVQTISEHKDINQSNLRDNFRSTTFNKYF